MAEEMDDDLNFPSDTINEILTAVTGTVLEEAEWDEKKAAGWINEIVEKVMK